MRKVLLTIICALVAMGCFGQGELPEKAFDRRLPQMAKELLAEWQRELPPMTKAELESSSDTLRNIYAIYNTLIKPISNGVEFYPVQDTVRIRFVDDIYYVPGANSDSLWYSVLSKIPNPDKHIARLLESYRETGKFSEIFRAMNAIDIDDVAWNIFNTSKPICVRNLRLQEDRLGLPYTAKYRNIVKSRDELRSYGSKPYRKYHYLGPLFYGYFRDDIGIHDILFDKDMKYAVVRYEGVYNVYSSAMKNDNGRWKVLSTVEPFKKGWTGPVIQVEHRHTHRYLHRHPD